MDALHQKVAGLLSAIARTNRSLRDLCADAAKIEQKYEAVNWARQQFNSWRNSYDGKLYKQALYSRQKGKCCSCSIELPEKYLQFDHILPIAKHPDLALQKSNLQLLCGPCNRTKGDR